MRKFECRRAAPFAALMATCALLGMSPAQAARDNPAALPGTSASQATSTSVGKTTLYRSTMPDGGIVLGDRPEPGARATEVIGSVPPADSTSAARAQQEREYWRQRSEAFARRQLLRELDEERERQRSVSHPPDLQRGAFMLGAPVFYRPHLRLDHAGQAVSPVYGTSPGAAGRNLAISEATLGVGAGFGAGVGFGGVSTGFGPGAAGGFGSSFIGSGFARSTR